MVDPLAGSYYVEHLTDRLEEEAESLIRQILDRGGMVRSIEDGFIQRQIADSSAAYQQALEAKEEHIVGVNIHVDEESELPFEPFELDPDLAARQIKRTQAVRKNRSQAEVGSCAEGDSAGGRQRAERDAGSGAGDQGAGDGRRDVRRAARGLRRIPRADRLLVWERGNET